MQEFQSVNISKTSHEIVHLEKILMSKYSLVLGVPLAGSPTGTNVQENCVHFFIEIIECYYVYMNYCCLCLKVNTYGHSLVMFLTVAVIEFKCCPYMCFMHQDKLFWILFAVIQVLHDNHSVIQLANKNV